MSLEKLQDEFITSFSLGNITDCVYIDNVDAIQCPLFVFKKGLFSITGVLDILVL